MPPAFLLHHLICNTAARTPNALALSQGEWHCSYAELQESMQGVARALRKLDLERGERIAVYLDKRPENVLAVFGASAAGQVFVPVNPVLKSEQVAHIARDCACQVLITNRARWRVCASALRELPTLRWVVLVDRVDGVAGGAQIDAIRQGEGENRPQELQPASGSCAAFPAVLHWQEWLDDAASPAPAAPQLPATENDVAAIFYTSGSTGLPKGVVLSHRNLVAGALSVASYLENRASDVLLAALPLSFDAGFSQLTTAFAVGARVELLNYLLPRDILKALDRAVITGLTAVPPLYAQLVRLEWPAGCGARLRYFASTGGGMPREILNTLRSRLPQARPFLMYGLTEAFRASYLPPEEVERRPDSIGRAIPNTELLVLREDGSPCAADEPGELVQRGPLVALGYWNDPARTAERFRPLPAAAGVSGALPRPETVVFSGDTVRRDAEGFLYFIGRRDEMIKTSGYRVSPSEVETCLLASQQLAEAVVFGVADPELGQRIVAAVFPLASTDHSADLHETLLAHCRAQLPTYQVPAAIWVHNQALLRNPNGKYDRALLREQWLNAASARQSHP